MKNLILSAVVGSVLTACATVPITGRRAFRVLPDSQMNEMGLQAYQDILKKSKPSKDVQAAALVRRVGERIARVADQPDFQWEFNLIEDPKNPNAFCLPGGKVAVYSGLLPLTKTDAGLAVVLGHEIAHAVAKHGAERMSQDLVAALGMEAAAVTLSKKSPETQKGVLAALGLGAQVGVLLPFSRTHESEADHIGLIYMAQAGYDPREAVAFWQRMETAGGGQAPPEFLSTHPGHERRAQDLAGWMPEALRAYQAAPK